MGIVRRLDVCFWLLVFHYLYLHSTLAVSLTCLWCLRLSVGSHSRLSWQSFSLSMGIQNLPPVGIVVLEVSFSTVCALGMVCCFITRELNASGYPIN
ncbi:hypothetical protein FKM82_025623 [Ascaphus truei]